MSKSGLFGLLFGWLVICTFLVNSVVAYDPTTDIAILNPLESFSDHSASTLIGQGTSLLKTFWRALTFQIQGLPVLFNLFFQIPTAIIGFMITQFIRGV